MSLDYDSLLKNLYKSFDFKLYEFCKKTFEKYSYLDLEELLLEIFSDKDIISNFFDKKIADQLYILLSEEVKKQTHINDKPSKYLLNAFLKANKLAEEKNELVSTELFLSAILITENKVSNYLKNI